ncbi:MAG: hypothetical protein ABIJ12_00740 [bacterium]
MRKCQGMVVKASIFFSSIFIILIFTINIHSANFPDKYNPIREYTGQSIFDIENVPEENIDIGLWSLIIAKECDSSINVTDYLHTLDTMASRVQYMVGPRTGDMVRFMMTKMYQFYPGEWNNSSIFSYDLDDPLGENPRSKLLSTY